MTSLILKRLQEPSTYAGIAALLMACGVHIPDDRYKAAAQALAAFAGAVAVFLGENGTPPRNS